jgi:hypothetical protein
MCFLLLLHQLTTNPVVLATEFRNGTHCTEIKMSTNCASLGKSKEEFLIFPASSHYLLFMSCSPFVHLQTQHCNIFKFFSDSDSTILFVTFVITCVHLDNLE